VRCYTRARETAGREPDSIPAAHLRLQPRAMQPCYHRADLAAFPKIAEDQPELAKKFFDWYGAVFADGALSAREKSLIALAVAHVVKCPYCIEAYTKDSLQKGADPEQQMEAVHVAAAIGGGAILAHATQMRRIAGEVAL
jgi:alkylhydroperoxidase/carboxymuconolactone decarboxylase family protein